MGSGSNLESFSNDEHDIVISETTLDSQEGENSMENQNSDEELLVPLEGDISDEKPLRSRSYSSFSFDNWEAETYDDTYYTYGDNGNMIETTTYDEEGILSYKATYEYDQYGNYTKITTNYYLPDGTTSSSEILYSNEYDENGLLIKYTDQIYEDNTLSYSSSVEYQYNASNTIQKDIYYINGELQYESEYIYSDGLLVAVESTGPDGYFAKREYVYDTSKRLILETIKDNNSLIKTSYFYE